MKSKKKQRILALLLSMVLMLSASISAMAEGDAQNEASGTETTENQAAAQSLEEETVPETEVPGEENGIAVQSLEGSEEPVQETEESVEEVPSETTVPAEEEPAETPAEESSQEVTQESEAIVSEAADLYQEFKDENGNVITSIRAYVPEGAFQARADQITMQVNLLDADSDAYIKGMIEEKLPENSYLGGYVLYEVNFMVDGAITEPAKAITLTIEGSGLGVTDLAKTKAFRYDAADPNVAGDKDELIEMGQKQDVLTYLAENGIAEDQISAYEYSELNVQNEVAQQIGFNTWKSTIYGCYIEAYSAEHTFTQNVNDMTVNVTVPEGAFPTAVENVNLSVTEVTEDQNFELSDKLEAKAEELKKEVKKFRALDFSFTVGGEEVQLQLPASVSITESSLSEKDMKNCRLFQYDEGNGVINGLEGVVEKGTCSANLTQPGIVGYCIYKNTDTIEWKKKVGKTIVKVETSKDALPENAELYVKEITDQKKVDEIEKNVTEKAIEEQFSIEKIIAYDIKFMVNDSEVQPKSAVQVSVDTPEIEKGQKASVLHLKDNNTVEDMGGIVEDTGNVVFDTTHFSTYVIVQEGDSEVEVTIQHLNAKTNKEIYSEDQITLPVGGKINGYAKAVNWNVQKVKLNDSVLETEEEFDELKVASDCKVIIYYTPKEMNISGAVRLYDYTVKAGSKPSWDHTTYYSFNQLGDEPESGRKLTAGAVSHNYEEYQYNFSVNGKKANDWTGTGGGVVTGLLKGLDANGNVEFNYPEPGFFEDSDATERVGGGTRHLRQFYNDYTLDFQQVGDTYTLVSVKDPDGRIATKAGEDFFPLDSEIKYYEEANKRKSDSDITGDGSTIIHNYYFGMRYDVNFKIGDYTGPLNYSFTGDDDLWVVLDGDEVVIDLGGIHDAATDTVDLWEYIGAPSELTDEQKEEEHTLTILYMERGAGLSNCQMEFTLPSASISEVTKVPMTDFSFEKTDKGGNPLSGARFTLENDATGEIKRATSGSAGTVTFRNLKEGTYTLTENVAPDGYVVSSDTWKVIVTSNGETATAALYKKDGITPVEDNKIINYTSQELASKNLKYDKTVQLTNWDDRTYQIDITASSNVSESSTIISKPVIDVMFVFDLSASMNKTSSGDNRTSFVGVGSYKSVKNNLDTTKVYYYGNSSSSTSTSSANSADYPMKYIDGKWQYYSESWWDGGSWNTIEDDSNQHIYEWDSRITALKEAASSFAINMADQSPQSKIGVATFSSNGYGKNTLVSDLAAVGSNEPTELLKKINQLFANGGTSPQDGLSLAKTELDSADDTNAKYVILFSDGAPSDSDDTSSSERIATELKEAGYTVITIGFGLTDDDVPGREGYWDWGEWIDGVTTEQWLKNYIASPGYAYTADSADELKKLFNDIQSSIMQTYDITGAQITDVIDARFELTDEEKARLTSDGAVITENADGTTTITWNDQTIPYLKDDVTAWSKTINIVAKADYIGGNNVTTNVAPDSCIHTGYGDAELPQPTVNVKAELEVDNYAVTIFKGDPVPMEEGCDAVVDSLFDVDKITEKYNNSKDPLTAGELTLSWYKDANLTQPVTEEELKTALSTPEVDTTYYLKVTYDAGSPSDDDESTKNTDGHIAGHDDGNTDTEVQAKNVDQEKYPGAYYGVYQIKVISGSIQITKTLDEASDKNQTFTFQIKDEDGNTQSVTITVPAGQTSAKADVITELSRGAYTVTETETEGYSVKEVSTEGSNCKEETKEDEITFTMGTFLEGDKEKDTITDTDKEYDKGILGVVNFTNEKTIADWEIIKKSSSDGGPTLGDAQFTLTKEGENIPSYYGKSVSEGEEKGQVQWYEDPEFENSLSKIPGGTYILEETKAPAGYQKSSIQWEIEVAKNGRLKQITLEGEAVTGNPVKDPETGVETVEYVYFNDAVYDLPSAGGPGIFLYMIGGTLLLMAGSLMIYINRRKGVLEK